MPPSDAGRTGPRLPAPYAPPDLDVRAIPEMPLAVERLRDSDAVLILPAEAFRAAVLLWAAAWHQVPAGTLPEADAQLAKLAGLGRDLAAWQGMKEAALHGFTLCRDGRYHHELIVDLAVRERSALRRRERYSEMQSAKAKASVRARKAMAGKAAQAAPGYDPVPADAVGFTLVDAAGSSLEGLLPDAAAVQAAVQAAANANGGKTPAHTSEQNQGDTSRGSSRGSAAADETPPPSPPPSLPSSVSPLKNPPSTPPRSPSSTPSTPEAFGLVADGIGDHAPIALPGAKVQRSSATPPNCPVEKILEAYHEELPALPAVRVLPDTTRKQLTTRWREDVSRQSIGWWRGYFRHVREECPFLVGATGHHFRASFDWLVRPLNLAKVVNGNYDREDAPAGGKP